MNDTDSLPLPIVNEDDDEDDEDGELDESQLEGLTRKWGKNRKAYYNTDKIDASDAEEVAQVTIN